MGSNKIFNRILITTIALIVLVVIFGILGMLLLPAGTARLIIIIAASLTVFVVTNIRLAAGLEKDIKNMIEKFKSSLRVIESNATQLSESSENLASGSSRQAAAIEETSATMNETEAMVAQNAENARIASQLTSESLQVVEEAGKYMMQLMDAMKELKESSDSVGKIIKTIDEIAFQTNLLAINATVEAARAGGDAGRSFAVVAEEVRNLAQKSASSTANTESIIEKNVSITNFAAEQAEAVLALASKNAKQMEYLNKLISEVSSASEEQASGIKQINLAVSQMEKVTQENAAVAEENAASSGLMKNELVTLEQVINQSESVLRNSVGASAANKPAPKPSASPPQVSKPAANKPAPVSTPAAAKAPPAPVKKAEVAAPQPVRPLAKAQSDAEKIIPLDDNDDF